MAKAPRESERMCIVTRRREPPEAMIRFVRGPDGVVAPDIRARLPGRGVWVSARAELVAEAAKKRLFARGLKEAAEAPPGLLAEVDRLLEADCLQMLSLANKAGGVVAGFNKVVEALERGGVGALVEALDGSEDGRRKLRQAARRAQRGAAENTPTVALFTSSQLDLALGRTNVIHAALEAGGAAAGFLTRCRKLAGYRGVALDGSPAETPGAAGPLDEFTDCIGPDAAGDRNLDE